MQINTISDVVLREELEPILKHRHKIFADELLKNGGNQRQAALAAGYHPASATEQAARLRKNPAICQYLEKKKKELILESDVTPQEIIGRLRKIATNLDEKTADRIAADQLLGKYIGMWRESPSSTAVFVNFKKDDLKIIKEIKKSKNNIESSTRNGNIVENKIENMIVDTDGTQIEIKASPTERYKRDNYLKLSRREDGTFQKMDINSSIDVTENKKEILASK